VGDLTIREWQDIQSELYLEDKERKRQERMAARGRRR
jgi:hypothetical protein